MNEAKEAALKTLALDETVTLAHLVLAYVLHYYEWDHEGAEREFRRALGLNPGDTLVRTNYASLLGMVGRVDEAVDEARAAVECDPVSAFHRFILAHSFVQSRRFEEAIAESHTGIGLDSSIHLSHTPWAGGWSVWAVVTKPLKPSGGT